MPNDVSIKLANDSLDMLRKIDHMLVETSKRSLKVRVEELLESACPCYEGFDYDGEIIPDPEERYDDDSNGLVKYQLFMPLFNSIPVGQLWGQGKHNHDALMFMQEYMGEGYFPRVNFADCFGWDGQEVDNDGMV